MIQKLSQLVGLSDINKKINEFDKELSDIKKMSDRTVDTQILSSFITNNKRDIQALLNTARQKIEQLKNSIDTKFNDYYTRTQSDSLFARSSLLRSFIRDNREETFDSNLNVGGNIQLNNTSGPIIQFGDGSLEVRPNYLKITAPNGSVPVEIKNGVPYSNGNVVMTNVNYISPGPWIELPNSRNVKRVNYNIAYEQGARQMLILYRYHDGNNNGHEYINHILIELQLGLPKYKDMECEISLLNSEINVTYSRDGYNGNIKAVYYR